MTKEPIVSPQILPQQKPYERFYHRHTLRDEYAWLRDPHWRDVLRDPTRLDPAISSHLKAENQRTESAMQDTLSLQKSLIAEMIARIPAEEESVPKEDGSWAYFTRYRTGGQHPLFCRKHRFSDTEKSHVLLDGDLLAEGKSCLSIGDVAHSPDHSLLAYTFDESGAELYTIRIRDLKSGDDRPDVIAGSSGSVIWSADSNFLFYVLLDDNHRARWVYQHKIGRPQTEDRLLHEEHDPVFSLRIEMTQDRQYLKIISRGHETSELHLLNVTDSKATPRTVLHREEGHQYELEHNKGTFYILTNKDAPDFRICVAQDGNFHPEHWRDTVPHEKRRLILSLHMLSDYLIWEEQYDGLSGIKIRCLNDGTEQKISLQEIPYSIDFKPGYEFETHSIRYLVSSMKTPSCIYDLVLDTQQKKLRKSQKIPSGYNPDFYVTSRLYATSHDGEQIPISLLYHRDTALDQSAPLYLYGYGAYGVSLPAYFSSTRLSLVNRGFIYAIAHVRGGKEKGYEWYSRGKLAAKKNSFLDFIASAQYLIDQGYVKKGHIVAEGRSAGGLLMGAVANMAPELFLAIIAGVPFVDTLNTMLDDSLPLTPPEWKEWGNPSQNREDFENILSYSPYDNISAKAYPHILATGGLTDPRVTYWEPAKWIARLRDKCTDRNKMLLLRTEMEAGHGGKSGRYDALEEIAFKYAFALKVAGVQNVQPKPASYP